MASPREVTLTQPSPLTLQSQPPTSAMAMEVDVSPVPSAIPAPTSEPAEPIPTPDSSNNNPPSFSLQQEPALNSEGKGEESTPPKNYHFNVSQLKKLTDAERDELCCLRLRFSFQTEAFSNVYMDLQKAGWTYDKQRYLPPDANKDDPNNLLTAKELQQHLDYYSLAGTIVSDLWEDSRKEVPRLAKGQEERWRGLRDDIIFHHYERRLRKENSGADESSSETQTAAATRTRANRKSETTDSAPTTRKQPSRQARKNASVTEVDRGAAVYMNKTRIQAQEKTRQKSLAAARQRQSILIENEDPVPFERLSLEECIAKGKEYATLPEVEQCEANYKEQFKDWRFLLGANHSLLLYGFGSKRQLLNEFAEKELSKEGYALTLDGFNPDITVEGILSLLVDVFLHKREPTPLAPCLPGFEGEEYTKVERMQKDPKSGQLQRVVHRKIKDPLQRAQAISKAMVSTQVKELFPVFLVIHNLEGLRTRLAQEVLSTLVAHGKTKNNIPVIRLVASIDHVDAPAVLWNERTSTQFRWMWRKVHTYRPHTDELIMLAPDEIKASSSGNKRRASGRQPKSFPGADRVIDVLGNLATRYTEVMQNLATLQLEATPGNISGNQKVEWVDASQLLQQCLNKCTVKCENQLRTFMLELEDHDMISIQKQGSTAVKVRIPYSEEKLQEILAFRPGKN